MQDILHQAVLLIRMVKYHDLCGWLEDNTFLFVCKRYASGHRLLSQLIEKRLELNTACYFRITCEDMRRVVVDGSGMNLMG